QRTGCKNDLVFRVEDFCVRRDLIPEDLVPYPRASDIILIFFNGVFRGDASGGQVNPQNSSHPSAISSRHKHLFPLLLFVAIPAYIGLIQRGSYPRRHFAGQVDPRHVCQGLCRTGFDTFWPAVAQKTFSGLGCFRIERDHLPGTGFQTYFAAGTLFRIDDTGVYGRFYLNGCIGTGIGARDGMWALFEKILNDQAGSPVPLSLLPGVEPSRTEIDVSPHLDPRRRRGRFSVIKIRAGKLASSTGDT